MFSKTPYSVYPPAQKRPTNSGFTLIELLMVIAVIMVLAGITFGISRGVQNAQARAQAKAELAVIAQALEGFKSAHGDYPWTTDSKDLAKALMGWMKFVRSSGSTTFVGVNANDASAQGPKSFLDVTKLNYLGQLPTEANKAPSNVEFTDPLTETPARVAYASPLACAHPCANSARLPAWRLSPSHPEPHEIAKRRALRYLQTPALRAYRRDRRTWVRNPDLAC